MVEWKYKRFLLERNSHYGYMKTAALEGVAMFLEELGDKAGQAKIVGVDDEVVVFFPRED